MIPLRSPCRSFQHHREHRLMCKFHEIRKSIAIGDDQSFAAVTGSRLIGRAKDI